MAYTYKSLLLPIVYNDVEGSDEGVVFYNGRFTKDFGKYKCGAKFAYLLLGINGDLCKLESSGESGIKQKVNLIPCD